MAYESVILEIQILNYHQVPGRVEVRISFRVLTIIFFSSHRMGGAFPTHRQDGESRQNSRHTRVVPSSASTTPRNQLARTAKVDAAAQASKKAQKREQVRSRQTSGGSGRRMLLPSESPQYNTLDHGSYERQPDSVREEHRGTSVFALSEVENMGYPPNTWASSNPALVPSASPAQHPTRNHDYRFRRHLPSDHTNVSSNAEQYMASTSSSTAVGEINQPCQRPFFAHGLSFSTPSSTNSITTWVQNVDRPRYSGQVGAPSQFRSPPTISISSSTHSINSSSASPPLSESGTPYPEHFFPDQYYPSMSYSAHLPNTNRPLQTPDQYHVTLSSQLRVPPALSASSSSLSPGSPYSSASSPLSAESGSHLGGYPRYSTHHGMSRQDIGNAPPSNHPVGQQPSPQQGIGLSAGIPMHPTDHRRLDVQSYENTLDEFGNLSFDFRPHYPHEKYSNKTDQDD